MHSILSRFGIDLLSERPDILIPGSPERCIIRSVIEDTQNRLWLVEQLAPKQTPRRESIAKLLADLSKAGAPHVAPFRQTIDGEYTLLAQDGPLQCSPFITGENLPRPDYIEDAWRGHNIGSFIAGLQQAGATLPTIPNAQTPDLAEYILNLADTLQKREPAIYAHLKPVLHQLDPFFSALPSLPVSLAHGDCHPLNIIWGANEIRGVIDWEFSGAKPTLYDAANCIGCVGFEHPDWLVRGLIPALIKTLETRRILNKANMPWLLPFTCALRFAWLSEWLRKKDREMIDMELDYFDILLRHGQTIQQQWNRLLSH